MHQQVFLAGPPKVILDPSAITPVSVGAESLPLIWWEWRPGKWLWLQEYRCSW